MVHEWTHRERKVWARIDRRNKPVLCLPWSCLGSGASRLIFCPSKLCHPRISIFHSVIRLGYLVVPGLIMQGLGKTERAEQGRDIDLTSLRSTMPASGPMQVSAFRKSFAWQSFSPSGSTLALSACLPLSPALCVTQLHGSFPGFISALRNVLPMWELRFRGWLCGSAGLGQSLKSAYDGNVQEISIRVWV